MFAPSSWGTAMDITTTLTMPSATNRVWRSADNLFSWNALSVEEREKEITLRLTIVIQSEHPDHENILLFRLGVKDATSYLYSQSMEMIVIHPVRYRERLSVRSCEIRT